MPITELLSQRLALAGTPVVPASQAAGESLTGAIDVSKYRQVLFVVQLGTLGASATVDFQVKGSATSGGSYAAVAGTAITQFVKATDDGKTAYVVVRTDQLNALGTGVKFIKGSCVVGTAASQTCVIPLGSDAEYEPAVNLGSTVAQSIVL